MSALWRKTLGDLRRRKLQGFVIALVIVLSSGAATLALNMLVESDAPYDHAFAQANGAHLIIIYDARQVSPAALRDSAHAHGVTAAAGPWPEAHPALALAFGGAGTRILGNLGVVGRERPDTVIDKLTMESGRWARAPGEIVLAQGMADDLGLQVVATVAAGDPTTLEGNGGVSLRVVGIAASISPGVGAWVVPGQIPALLSPQSPLAYQMLYRVAPAATAAQLGDAAAAITAHLPAGTVLGTDDYLRVKRNADLLSAVMIPFLLAFSAFALLAAVFIIANVVAGVVLADYREIGIMKSVGFTPGQVTAVLLGQILLPVLAGALIGIPLGTLGSQPFLRDTAHALGLPAPFTAAIPVDLAVLSCMLAVATLAALAPCRRAGRLSAVAAITMGTAPAAGHATGMGEALARLPLPRPASLGLSDAFARPVRSLMTLGAIVIGVATIVFALSLHSSLGEVATHLIRDTYVQVNVYRAVPNGPGALPGKGAPGVGVGAGPPTISDAQTTALLRADPGTARFTAETQEQIAIPNIAQPIPYYAYRGPSAWLGYALIQGRWFRGPGEVVAPTKLLAQAHLAIGQTITAHMDGRLVRLRIVGEILDQSDDNLLVRGDWSTLAAVNPGATPDHYEVQIKPGVDADAYAGRLRAAGGGALDAQAAARASEDTSFILLNVVIAGLALVLIAIAVTGVFNTVILTTRERARDVAILKAVGMAPRQVVSMVVASVAFLGLIAGGLGLPLGLVLHGKILLLMGQIASDTGMPPRFLDPLAPVVLPLLALSGVAVAALGAWLPAQWAASSGVAEVLQAE